ncbi:hypothetical protein FACS1894188_01860 [Clostridia bacterium]|nr:hypothetical protein FACS1894188_01860 [Clostridia bacterium]
MGAGMKTLKKLRKSSISFVLVFAIIFGTIPPVRVFAAFTADSFKIQSAGERDNSTWLLGMNATELAPERTTDQLIPSDIFSAEWDFGDNGKYELTYPLEKFGSARLAKVTITKISKDKATVEFSLDSADNTALRIHTGKPEKSPEYNDYKDFEGDTLNEYNTASPDGTEQVVVPPEDNPIIGNPTNYLQHYSAMFNIYGGTIKNGISFEYDGVNVSILWDGNKMYYMSDGIEEGRIFPATLDVDRAGAAVVSVLRKVFTGIDTSSVKSEPYANIGADLLGDGRNSRRDPLDPRSDDVINENLDEPDTVAGDKETRLDISFDEPLEWDGTAKQFGAVTPGSYELQLSVGFNGGETTNTSWGLTIDDIFGASPSIIEDSRINAGLIDSSYSTIINKDAANRTTLQVFGVAPSTMFSAVVFSPMLMRDAAGVMRDRANPEPGTTTLPIGTVYTYIQYALGTNGDYVYFYPYRGEAGHGEYQLRSNRNAGPLPVATIEINTNADYKKILMVPIYGDSQSSNYYFTFVPRSSPDTIVPASQYIKIKPPSDTRVGLPNEFDASVIELTPITKTDYTRANLSLDFKWDVGTTLALENYFKLDKLKPTPIGYAEVEYELRLSDAPKNPPVPETYAKIRMRITQDKDADGNTIYNAQYTLLPVAGIPSEWYPDDATYAAPIPLTLKTSNNTWYAGVKISFPNGASHLSTPETTTGVFKFKYPKVYFSVLVPTKLGDKDVDPSEEMPSPYANITLDDITPRDKITPSGIAADNPVVNDTQVSFDYSFTISGRNLIDRLKILYTDNSLPLDQQARAFANIYISTDEAKLRDAMPDTFAQRESASVSQDITSIVSSPTVYGQTVYFSDFGTPSVPLFAGGRDALRAGKVAALTHIPIKITGSVPDSIAYKYILDGLDANTTYYIRSDVVIEDVPWIDAATSYSETSRLSEMAFIVMPTEPKVPDGKDKTPPAPVLSYRDVESKSAVIEWQAVADPATSDPNSGVTIEYEIIRLRDGQMPANLLDTQGEFSAVWTKIGETLTDTEKIGLRTKYDLAGDKLEVYDGSAFSASKPEEFVPSLETNPLFFQDKTLYPNNIYFYYVRTVKHAPMQPDMYSGWSRVTFTTDPVGAPINLKISDKKPTDGQKEIYFEFDAPAEETLLDDVLTLWYSLKKNTDAWAADVQMKKAELTASASTVKDYTHYQYKLTGLEPGTTYQLRVKMMDKNGDSSMYSNIVSFRTEFKQDDYDDKHETDDWLDWLGELLKDILKEKYWELNETDKNIDIVYKTDRVREMIDTAQGSLIPLYAKDGAAHLSYYIPQQLLAAANDAKKGFLIQRGNTSVAVSPLSVTTYHDTYIGTYRDLQLDRANDFYLRLDVDFTDTTAKINGDDPISPEAKITASLVETGKITERLDAEQYAQYTILIDRTIKDEGLYNSLMNRTKASIFDEDFVRYIENIVNVHKHQFQQITRNSMRDLRAARTITAFEKPIIISQQRDGGSSDYDAVTVKGYKRSGSGWTDIPAVTDPPSISALELGTYIIAGKIVKIQGIQGIENGGNISGIVGKYDLGDTLGSDNLIKTDSASTLSRGGAVDALAKVSGAPAGADSVKWLKEKHGLSVSSRSKDSPISSEESVYLAMLFYETKTNAKVSSLKTQNFSNPILGNVSAAYKPYVRAALDLGIVTELDPKTPMTTKTYLEILGRLDAKLKL